MMGSCLSRALLMVFGYAYPAYECFKTVEKKNKPETEHLLFWCRYWILVAMFSVGERVGDTFISWLPMYGEAKLAFLIYLWYPKTKGTAYVYNYWLRPFIAKHETRIDHNLLELEVKGRQIGLLLWQKAEGYGQTRFLEIIHYFSSQSSPSHPHFDQQQQLDCGGNGPNQKQSEHFLADSCSESLLRKNNMQAEEAGDMPTSPSSQHTAAQSNKKMTHDQSATESNSLETMPNKPASSPESRNGNSSEQIKISNKSNQQTRGKWRIFRAASNRSNQQTRGKWRIFRAASNR